VKSKTVINVLIGLVLAILTVTLHLSLSEENGLELTSFLLVLIGSVYVGFGLLSDNKSIVAIELFIASIFILMGILGLWISPWILVSGLFMHGLWDIAHHNSINRLAEIPQWYVPFCATYDWAMAIYLTITYWS